MIIGFDGSRSFIRKKTGTENYAYYLLKELLLLDKKNKYKIYLRPSLRVYKGELTVDEWLNEVQGSLPKTDNYEFVVISRKTAWTQVGLALELFKNPVDVLFVPAHTLPYFRPKKIKTVVTIHDLGYEYLPQYHKFPQGLWLTTFTDYAAQNADALIAVSEATKEDILSRYGASVSKVHVVYEGFDPDKYVLPEPEKLHQIIEKHVGANARYLFFVGTIQPRKNLLRLIDAFAELMHDDDLRKEYPDLKLVLAGKSGWLNEDIYARPTTLGIEEKVSFLGYVSDDEVVLLMSQARVLAFPSLFEGFGLPIIEAQYLEVPVVTSDKPPMNEVGGEGACEYVNPEDVESIKEGLKKVLLDENFRAYLKSRGYENAIKYSWQQAARDTLEVFEQLI